ncbi:selenide, water dikinase SelD [Lentimicrobium sp. L6]|nr:MULTISPECIES: selenide, water dikinase SelD [unclassified Lentimicrobium]NPD45493.1 selenide, water dikinase SelD [Lentimicrobium sp. S6]NPD84003.1 selenide, water dikinase SelD [Lentimicrobium sp. L6]
MIYLDYNATTPIDPIVAEAMRPYLEVYFGNPSSSHQLGAETKKAIEKARKQVADLIGAESSEIIFTSGGTESNNYALKGAAFANKHKGNHIITSSIEHPAIFEVCKYLERNGFEVTYLPVDEFGIIHLKDLEEAIKKETILISVMHANNEVGSIQPISKIGKIAQERGILLHSDAAQSIGKVAVDVKEMGLDLMSIAGHKLYAPKGIGAIYIKEGVVLEKLMHGADHEQNMRAGTENVLEIVGLGKAAEMVTEKLKDYQLHYANMRDMLWDSLKKELPHIKRNGHAEKCLANTLSVSFPKIEANTLIARLENVAASAGAACHSESIDVSVVLEAMNIPLEFAMGTIRFSTGRTTSKENIDAAVKEVVSNVKILMPKADGSTIHLPENRDISKIKLTQYTHGLGCACKIEPQKLQQVLKSLPQVHDVNVLVGTDTSDDAAVYRLTDELALVQTLDFFTPIVDDPFQFGAIAAANALSDVYAMGARPIFALNIVGFPEEALPMEVLELILKGAQSKAEEAGIPILGGHTIEDPEPKYGMVVSGLVHPDQMIKNKGAKIGEVLVLTKPIGTGIISTGIKRGLVNEKIAKQAIELMSSLNKIPAEIMSKYDVSSCTDVTGFGLMGHLKEMVESSDVTAEISFDAIPFIDTVKDLAAANIIPGGTYNNRDYVEHVVDFGKLSRTSQLLICDAQTSGGLLVCLPPAHAELYVNELKNLGMKDVTIIGEIIQEGSGIVIK